LANPCRSVTSLQDINLKYVIYKVLKSYILVIKSIRNFINFFKQLKIINYGLYESEPEKNAREIT